MSEEPLMSFQMTCKCGKKLKVHEEDVGELVECPACQRQLRVVDPDTAVQGEDRTRASRRPRDEDDDEPEERGGRRSRKKGAAKVSLLAIFSLITGVAAVCVPCLMAIPSLILGIIS